LPDIGLSENQAHGEYTTNVAMKLAKKMNKSPIEIALQVKESINNQQLTIGHKGIDQNITQSGQKMSRESSGKPLLQDFESIEVVPPGFINFKISEAKLSTELSQVLNEKEAYGTVKTTTKKVMVEFTDPNPFKELHIGHLYSNAVGESLARLYEANGWIVKRADYFGDVGMHVAKTLWGFRKKLSDEKTNLINLSKLPLSDRVHYLGQAYALGSTTYENDEKAADEIKDINYLVYMSAQMYMKKVYKWKPVVDYSQYVKGKEEQFKEISGLFETGRKWSMDYFKSVFVRLGTKFDYFYPESITGEYGAKIVKEHIGDIFEYSDGAVVYRGDKEGLHTRVFMNSLGLPTYEAKEMGLAVKKDMDYSPDLSLIVTGKEINEYFQVLMSAISKFKPEIASKSKHIGHGMVRLPQGKMSSRTGHVLTAEWLLEEVKNNINNILDNNKSKYRKVEQLEIAEKATIAAIKYSFLKVGLPSDIAFDLEKSVSFEGDSGPYLLYTYARCKSVLRKADGKWQIADGNNKFNPEERAIARLILVYPDIVKDAAAQLAPNKLCTHLYLLAQAFNLFYAKHSILGNEGRLALTASTAQVLKNGLYLLGIETVERM